MNAIEPCKTHTVIATYRGNQEAAESLRAQTGAEIIQSDISSAGDRQSLLSDIEKRHGRLDLLVNNAGIAPRERRDVLEATESSFDDMIGTNLNQYRIINREKTWDCGNRFGYPRSLLLQQGWPVEQDRDVAAGIRRVHEKTAFGRA